MWNIRFQRPTKSKSQLQSCLRTSWQTDSPDMYSHASHCHTRKLALNKETTSFVNKVFRYCQDKKLSWCWLHEMQPSHACMVVSRSNIVPIGSVLIQNVILLKKNCTLSSSLLSRSTCNRINLVSLVRNSHDSISRWCQITLPFSPVNVFSLYIKWLSRQSLLTFKSFLVEKLPAVVNCNCNISQLTS